MDDPALPDSEHMHALVALRTINAISLTARRLADAVCRLLPRGFDRPLVIADLACGGGDVTLALADLLATRRAGRGSGRGAVRVIGVDVSSRAVDRARNLAARRGCPATEFIVGDIVADGCPPCDVAVSSLFLHHLDDADAGRVLSSMAATAGSGCAISDLLRSWAGLALAVVGTTLLSTSRVVRFDGPVSVRAARTMGEYRQLLDDAGLAHAGMRRTWPERCVIEWKSTSHGAV
ncbi:MAG: methyltransferase domain-containing protein [Planctomycetia bacterium]|nr:methyltransferase domain-containing protein [Planctomycetia bacterium]